VASDVDPGNIAGQRTAELAVVIENAAEQTTQEQTEERPAVVTMAETCQGGPGSGEDGGSTPTRGDEAARTPPSSSVAEEGDKASMPAEERRTPTPPQAEASSPKGSPGRGKGPLVPVTTAGGSAEGEEAQVASDDEVDEIQGRPHDGRQHVYVWHQHGDHFIGHEELAETEEAARVERTARRLVDEVKVSGHVLNQNVYIVFACSLNNMYISCRAQCKRRSTKKGASTKLRASSPRTRP
jgi:hypothetical protein